MNHRLSAWITVPRNASVADPSLVLSSSSSLSSSSRKDSQYEQQWRQRAGAARCNAKSDSGERGAAASGRGGASMATASDNTIGARRNEPRGSASATTAAQCSLEIEHASSAKSGVKRARAELFVSDDGGGGDEPHQSADAACDVVPTRSSAGRRTSQRTVVCLDERTESEQRMCERRERGGGTDEGVTNKHAGNGADAAASGGEEEPLARASLAPAHLLAVSFVGDGAECEQWQYLASGNVNAALLSADMQAFLAACNRHGVNFDTVYGSGGHSNPACLLVYTDRLSRPQLPPPPPPPPPRGNNCYVSNGQQHEPAGSGSEPLPCLAHVQREQISAHRHVVHLRPYWRTYLAARAALCAGAAPPHDSSSDALETMRVVLLAHENNVRLLVERLGATYVALVLHLVSDAEQFYRIDTSAASDETRAALVRCDITREDIALGDAAVFAVQNESLRAASGGGGDDDDAANPPQPHYEHRLVFVSERHAACVELFYLFSRLPQRFDECVAAWHANECAEARAEGEDDDGGGACAWLRTPERIYDNAQFREMCTWLERIYGSAAYKLDACLRRHTPC